VTDATRFKSAELLDELRPRAFAIAYRMLGSVSEAEDVVQEALLRFHRAVDRGEEISSPRAYVATVVTRLAIDELRSARARRESYVGEWLPEPISTNPEDDPAERAEMTDSISLAFLVLLEALTPEQRAAFLLHDVFEYGYAEVARIIETSEANARQLGSRARRHVQEGRPRFEPSAEQRERLASRFFAAVREGDLAGLEALLAEDVALHGDGAGKAPALARAVTGRVRAARTLLAWAKAVPDFATRPVQINGQPGAVILDPSGRRVISVLSLEIADGQIQAIRSIVNPDKLGHLGPVADVRALIAAGRKRPG
jgi:RNA polymerase sigma-70 factor (ECF subfamily)